MESPKLNRRLKNAKIHTFFRPVSSPLYRANAARDAILERQREADAREAARIRRETAIVNATWVKNGIAALSTPLMVEAIAKAFATDAFLTEMRCPELYASAKERARLLLPAAAAVEEEAESEIDEDLEENSQLSLMSF